MTFRRHRLLRLSLTTVALAGIATVFALPKSQAVQYSENLSTPSIVTRATTGSPSPDPASPLPTPSATVLGAAKLPANNTGFGLAASQTLYYLPDAELQKQLDDYSQLGATWIRIDIPWVDVQANDAGSYYWVDVDRVIVALRQRGFNVLGTIAYTPAWARNAGCNTDKCMPARLPNYSDFSGKVAARYASLGVHAWEVWNEPNVQSFWQPRPSVDDYANMLKAASREIKKADSQAVVITGGTAPAATSGADISPSDFLNGLYRKGTKNYFDAVGHHPYCFPALPSQYYEWSGWSVMGNTPNSLRTIMNANGDESKKIWATESGVPTNGPGPGSQLSDQHFDDHASWGDELFQAQTVTEVIQLSKVHAWSGPVFWYSYKDRGTDPTDNENFFGLLRADGSHKAAYDAFKQAIAAP